MKNKLNRTLKLFVAFGICLTLTACGGESASKYSFNFEEFKKNTKQYVLSKGEMDELGCFFMSLMFTKEVLEGLVKDVKPNMDDAENFSPTTINVYKDKIEWVDVDLESELIAYSKDGTLFATKLSLPDGEVLELEGNNEGEVLLLGFKEKEVHCNFPFSKIN